MATNKASRDSMVVIAVIVAACVMILANLLADKKFARIDLTKEGRYSLSQPFTNIIGRLDDTLRVTYYVSEKGPEGFEQIKRDMLDKLQEIETASKGKIKVTAIDPTNNKDLRERLTKENFLIELMGFQKDQKTMSRVFSGLEITYQAKDKIPIPQIGQPEMLEYAIGSSIVDLTTTKKPIIAVYAPRGAGGGPMMPGQPQESGFEWISQGQWDQEKKFDIKQVDLTEGNTIPPDTSLFMMFRPRDLNERQKYEVARYLAGGGKMLLAASSFNVSYEFGARVEKTPSGLEDYLKELGVTMGQDFIADNSSLKLPVRDPFNRNNIVLKTFPLFINILQENIDQESVLTKLLPNMVVLSPAAIALDNAKLEKNSLKGTVLAKTSKQTWVIPYADGIDLNRETEDDENRKYDGSRNVFVMLDGQFPFNYEGKPVPAWDHGGAPPPPDQKDKKDENATVVKKPGWLAIFSGPEAFQSLYINSRDLGQFMQNNVMVVRNITDNFGMGDDLIRMRTKTYEARTIKALGGAENDVKRTVLKVALIGGTATALFVFALGWFLFRRAAQTRYERSFAQTIGPSSFTND